MVARKYKVYITGLSLIIIGLLVNTVSNGAFIDGESYGFLNNGALIYLPWGFIIAGILIIIFESARKHHIKKILIFLNRPMSYFILFATLLSIFALVLNVAYSVIFICIIAVGSIVTKMIYNKNYMYILSLIFTIYMVLEHIIERMFNGQIPYLLSSVIIISSICTEVYLIARTVTKMTRKGIQYKDLVLFFDFTFIYAFTIYFSSGYYSDIVGTNLEYLKNPNYPYATVMLLFYATYMLYVVWEKHKLDY